MANDDPSLPLQGALFDVLYGLGIAEVYDDVPDEGAFPRITFGSVRRNTNDADCYLGSETFIELIVWSRSVGFPEAKRIAGQVRVRLHNTEDLFPDGHTLEHIEVQNVVWDRDADGLTSRARIFLRILTQPVDPEAVLEDQDAPALDVRDRADPALPIQAALVQAIIDLDTEAGESVYDDVPEDVFPRVTVGPAQSIPTDIDCGDQTESLVQIDVWSRSVGYPEVKRIAGEIQTRLHLSEYLPIEGHVLELLEVESVDYERDPDGLTSRARIEVRLLTQSVGSSDLVIDAGVGTFVLTGQSAQLVRTHIFAADTGTFLVAGQDASFIHGLTIGASVGTFVLAGQATALLYGRMLGADVGTYVLSGQDAGLFYGRMVGAGVGTFTLSGQAAGLTWTRLLQAEVGTFVLSGQAVALLYGHKVDAGLGTFSLSGQTAALLYGRKLNATVGTFALTGQAAELIYSAAADSLLLEGDQSGNLLLEGDQSGSLLLEGSY